MTTMKINYDRANDVVRTIKNDIESEGWSYYRKVYLRPNGELDRFRVMNLIISRAKYLTQNGMASEHRYIESEVIKMFNSFEAEFQANDKE